MNILILNWRDVWHPKAGGAEYVTYEHAKFWVKMGHRVTWFTSRYRGASKTEIRDGVRIVRSLGSYLVHAGAPFFLLRNAGEFDVIVDEVHGIPFFSPLFTRKPVVVFIHEVADEIWDYMYKFPVNVIGKLVERLYFWIYRNKRFWTDAPSTITELTKRGIPRDQCEAIPCPIDTPAIKPKPKESVPTFIFVSRVVRMKGIEEVVKAFSFIIKEIPESRLWIVGGGDTAYIESLKAMISEYGVSGAVTFFGRVSDVKKFDLMSRAHILLHASVKEGWGLVVLEAGSVGTPAIVYNVPGLKDVVKDGYSGIVLSNNSPFDLASEAVRLIRSGKYYEQLRRGAKQRAGSFSWQEVTGQSLQLLESAVQR